MPLSYATLYVYLSLLSLFMMNKIRYYELHACNISTNTEISIHHHMYATVHVILLLGGQYSITFDLNHEWDYDNLHYKYMDTKTIRHRRIKCEMISVHPSKQLFEKQTFKAKELYGEDRGNKIKLATGISHQT